MAMPTRDRHYTDKPNFSCVSRGEIVTAMRDAKNPKQQKKILAELCCCSIEAIEKVLGEDVEATPNKLKFGNKFTTAKKRKTAKELAPRAVTASECEMSILRKQYGAMEAALAQRAQKLLKRKHECAEYDIVANLVDRNKKECMSDDY